MVGEDEEIFEIADDQVANLTDIERWEPREIALLTTKRRHDEHKNRADADRMGHWDSLWNEDSVFYCSVSGFKGLERSVVVLAVDGFHDGVRAEILIFFFQRAKFKTLGSGNKKSKKI